MTRSLGSRRARALGRNSYLLLVVWGLSVAGGWGCSDAAVDADDAATGGVGTEPDDAGSGGGPASGGAQTTGGATGGGTGGSGTGGSGTGGSGTGGGPLTCEISDPPSQFTTTLDATWAEMIGEFEGETGARPANGSVLEFTNTLLDQLLETEGQLNYCVRYESTVTLSATQRDALEAALERNVNEWIDALEGYDCFPYSHVDVKVVGWAAMNRATFDWEDDEHPGLFYIGDDSHESAPQCAQACGRFFHREAGYQYPGCSGGRANHYDVSLWLTEGMSGGAGGDWGQRVGRGYFIGAVEQPTLHILSHEIGHGFGFPDYYNWSVWMPGTPAPPSIMVAGAAGEVTEWDTWMMRRLWSELRRDRGW